MRDLTWLHISDIHFNSKTEWRDCLSREALIEYLKDLFSRDDSLRPDFIFCTGDIAFGESPSASMPEQYDNAKRFFDDLLVVASHTGAPLPRERLFVVPGNHDVMRSKINSDVQETLNLWAKESSSHVERINQRFNDRTKEFTDTITRLGAYGDFVKDYLPHQFDAEGRHHFTHITEVRGVKVGIAGFNSSWTCSGPEDDRNIWMAAKWQFNTASAAVKDADIRIGLIHHPMDWVNHADRELANRRIASDFDFWLHGHSHNAWVTPVQSHIVIAAGAVAAEDSDEFGVNLTSIDLTALKGATHLHSKHAGGNGWTITPIEGHAPTGRWAFDLPMRMKKHLALLVNGGATLTIPGSRPTETDFVERSLARRLEDALQSFSAQPKVWISPILSRKSELTRDARDEPRVDLANFVVSPRSTIIKAPPQFGLTCLAHFLALEAWRSPAKAYWLILNAEDIKPHAASINDAVSSELSTFGLVEQDIKCIILDSWSSSEKDAHKLLSKVSDRFKGIPLVCMERVDASQFHQVDSRVLSRPFELLYLWSLPRDEIRKIVEAYNDARPIGDEDAVTARLVSDLDVLNLHRTPLNCITLLKVSELDFDESPVNRSEVIKRVLFLLFNVDEIPTYKSRPDLKDCEYVLGYFCELLIRDGSNSFSRDKFLFETQRFCKDSLIDLETQVVFDVLVKNSILIKRGSFFSFKFTYWIFYFAAQRMHHDPKFASYVFDGMRYAQHPELIEFYTGIDRRRDDALHILIKDIAECKNSVRDSCGWPEGFNPYDLATWNPSPDVEAQMHKIISDGVQESSLPATIKDQFADRTYDQTKPYDQTIANLLNQHSFMSMMQTMKAGARALRNSDYVAPEIKRRLLEEILGCWEQASKVLMIVLPTLAADGHAAYGGMGFYLASGFGDTPKERFIRVLCEIPYNIVSWCRDDLFSRKMGPLLIDQLGNDKLGKIAKHELMVLLAQGRPKDWNKQVQAYIAANRKNSYYLFDIYKTLRQEYRYSFASPSVIKEIEYLIKMSATKHITGAKEPGIESIKKVKFAEGVIPQRE